MDRIHLAQQDRWRKPPRECPDCGATDHLVFFYGCTHEHCPVMRPDDEARVRDLREAEAREAEAAAERERQTVRRD